MDNEQAKTILSAWRAGQTSPADDALLLEALDRLETDPALAAWYGEQPAFDAGLAESLRAIQPPSHLRETILAAARVTPMPSSTRRFPIWLALAAGIVIAVAMLMPHGPSTVFAQIANEVPQLNSQHEHAFASQTGDLDTIRAWLAGHGGATNFSVPAGLQNLGGIGCEVASIADTKVSVLCFHTHDGSPVHLYVLDRSQLVDPPRHDKPVLSQQGKIAMASWSDATHSYILARSGDIAGLPRYF